jgi:nitrogen fixation NifU-like protein
VQELQQQIIEQAREVYLDKVIEEFYHPKSLGYMYEPDACGIVRGSCGDTMEIYVRLKGDRIEKAVFMTDGYGATVACGSMLTQMVTAMSLAKASQVRPVDLVVALDGLPEESFHCAELAVTTPRDAICSRGAVHQP